MCEHGPVTANRRSSAVADERAPAQEVVVLHPLPGKRQVFGQRHVDSHYPKQQQHEVAAVVIPVKAEHMYDVHQLRYTWWLHRGDGWIRQVRHGALGRRGLRPETQEELCPREPEALRAENGDRYPV